MTMQASDITNERLKAIISDELEVTDWPEMRDICRELLAARAELACRTTPKVSEPEVRIKTHNEVAEYISRLGWSEYATSREKTLVAGNIWTFWVLMCGGKPEDTKQEELSVFSNPPIDEWRDGNLARSLDSVCDGCANRKPVSLDALAIAVRGYMEQVEKVYPDDVRHLEIMIRNYERLVNG